MWTVAKLQQLKAEGKIRGYTVFNLQRKGARKAELKRKGKEKYWMGMNLRQWCLDNAVGMVTEYQFLEHRKFRFDWAMPILKIAVEYEGIFSEKSRHTTPQGYSRDAEKYNAAAADGWKVLRYTAVNYKNLLADLEKLKP